MTWGFSGGITALQSCQVSSPCDDSLRKGKSIWCTPMVTLKCQLCYKRLLYMAPGEQTTPAQLEPLSPEVKATARAVTGWWQHGRSTSGTCEAPSSSCCITVDAAHRCAVCSLSHGRTPELPRHGLVLGFVTTPLHSRDIPRIPCHLPKNCVEFEKQP